MSAPLPTPKDALKHVLRRETGVNRDAKLKLEIEMEKKFSPLAVHLHAPCSSFNLLFYGYGSKIETMTRFVEQCAVEHSHIIVAHG